MTKHLQTGTPTMLGGPSKDKRDPKGVDAKLTGLMSSNATPLSYRKPEQPRPDAQDRDTSPTSLGGADASEATGFRRATGISDRVGTITLEQTHYHLDGARPDDIRPTHIPLKGGIQI